MRAKILGIVGSFFKEEDGKLVSENYEVNELKKRSSRYFDEAIFIDPRRLSFFFDNTANPLVLHMGQKLPELSGLIIRGALGIEQEICLLAEVLSKTDCVFLDSHKLFSGATPSKLTSTAYRDSLKVGVETFIGFSVDDALTFLEKLSVKSCFPLIAKPIAGSQGEGVVLLSDEIEARAYVDDFFSRNSGFPVFLQKKANILEEYRVVVLRGSILGVVGKKSIEGKITRNYAQGSEFYLAQNEDVVDFVRRHTPDDALYGVDVAVLDDSQMMIIETNRSPKWKGFDAHAGINVAEKVLEYVAKGI